MRGTQSLALLVWACAVELEAGLHPRLAPHGAAPVHGAPPRVLRAAPVALANAGKRFVREEEPFPRFVEAAPTRMMEQERAEQLRLIEEVQRLNALREIYNGLPGERELFYEAASFGGGSRSDDWAAAAGVTPQQLQHQLLAGLRARDQVVETNMGLVWLVLNRLRQRRGLDPGTTFADLAQEGALALLRSAELFSVEKGYKFSTYATTAIERRVMRAIADKARLIRIPVYIQERAALIKKTAFDLQKAAGPGDWPTDEQIAAKMQEDGQEWVTVESLRDVLWLVGRRPRSLEASVERAGDKFWYTQRLIERDISAKLESLDIQGKLREELNAIMARVLSPEEERVLRLRFGIGTGDVGPYLNKEVAAEMGIQSSRASHLFWEGVRKLRNPLIAVGVLDSETYGELIFAEGDGEELAPIPPLPDGVVGEGGNVRRRYGSIAKGTNDGLELTSQAEERPG